MLLAIEGVAGSGKSTVRDRLLIAASEAGVPLAHVGQHSWLSLAATRTIVGLRAGRPAPNAADALTAVVTDLRLHTRYNIGLAHRQDHVVADRLLLSTACLLALVHGNDPGSYLRRLSEVEGARPELTIVLTTPPGVSAARLDGRRTRPRFGEAPEALARLSGLYRRAADVWSQQTGAEVLVGPSVVPGDADRLVTAALARLQAADPPA